MVALFLLAASRVAAIVIPVEEPPAEGPPRIWPRPESSIPANHLKFYLHFARPMERGDVFRHLRLVEIDREGKEVTEVPEPFREIELWDETFTRMTLWLHPGRQKPGVNLNVDIGPILEAGKHYRLEISSEWKSESGDIAFPDGVSYRFVASPADNECPDPETWKVSSEAGATMIRLLTDESLDVFSTVKRITLQAKGEPGKALATRVFAQPGSLLFQPKQPLPAGDYKFVIDPKLEDLAGNSIARPFNLDLEKHPDFEGRTELVVIPFSVPESP